MSRQHHAGKTQSQRMLRVGELIRHAVAEVLTRGTLNDPLLEGQVITVPEVRISPDLKLATVYIMPLGGERLPEILKALERHKKFLRGEMAHKINLKFTPELRFRADESFGEGDRIEKLLRSPQVQRDLSSEQEQDGHDLPADDDEN
jgi:ribosome-binding factor A